MAKRKPVRAAKPAKSSKKRPAARRAAPRPAGRTKAKAKASAKKKAPAKKAAKKPQSKPKVKVKAQAPVLPIKAPRLDRARKVLDEREPHDTPPSSLDMDQHGSAARSGRAAQEHSEREHRGMSSDIQGGDVDVDVEDAYFTGDEAPGGDNPSPDMEVVDEIGKALGVEYDDDEQLKASDKVTERDKHRWELDPASAEDFKDHE
jgi:hypothetical protein